MTGDPRVVTYIAALPPDARTGVEALREVVRAVAPGAAETISYGIPTFVLDGRALVHIAGWKHHVSLYPLPDGDTALERDMARYRAGRGTLRMPLSEPLPHDLVRRIVERLVQQRAAEAG